MSPDERQALEDLHTLEPDACERKKVLIVDDDMRNIFALATVLDEQGMEIVSANNGREAIRMVEADPTIDIVLMDIMMPEMDGIDHHPGDPQAAARQGPADHRGDGEGDEGRPREVHRGGRLGLPVEAGRPRAAAGRAARWLAVSELKRRDHDGAGDILIVDDLPEKLLVFSTVLEDLGQNLIMVALGRGGAARGAASATSR